jgi:hypothetical protein
MQHGRQPEEEANGRVARGDSLRHSAHARYSRHSSSSPPPAQRSGTPLIITATSSRAARARFGKAPGRARASWS